MISDLCWLISPAAAGDAQRNIGNQPLLAALVGEVLDATARHGLAIVRGDVGEYGQFRDGRPPARV